MMHLTSCLENNRFEPLIFCMLVTVNLLAKGLVSGAELLLCLGMVSGPELAGTGTGTGTAADADIQEELARMIRMI